MVHLLIGLLSGIIIALILLIWKLPDQVQYILRITINAPIASVYDAIRFQSQLMEWSVWPKETKSQCEVRNDDGKIGAQTIYLNQKGKEFGYQEIQNLVINKKISFYLKSYLAPFEESVSLEFILDELEPSKTEVSLWFDEKLKKPHFLIAYFGNIIPWVRNMHIKDLKSLKIYVEEK